MADSPSPIRRQVRTAVLTGGGWLREAAGGLREGLQQLQDSPLRTDAAQSLERELEQARQDGRWLSDEERAERQRLAHRIRQGLGEDQRRRRSLLILLGVSLLLPPLWPLALVLTAYLLFPRTTARLTAVALVLAGLGGLLLLVLLVALLVLLF